MSHIQFAAALIALAVAAFIFGTLLSEAFNMYKRHQANKWRAIDFLLPELNTDVDHTHITRSITVSPHSIQFSISCGDQSTTDTYHYHTSKGAKKNYVKHIREIEASFFERHGDYIKSYKGETK